MRSTEIWVKGHIDPDWSEWLEGFEITHVAQNQTLLSGVVADQPGLFGILTKLRDMGLEIVTVHVSELPNAAGSASRSREIPGRFS